MKCPGKAGTKVYQYVNPSQIGPYWQLAQQYVLADQMFQTQGSGSFTAHQSLNSRRHDSQPEPDREPGRFSIRQGAMGMRRLARRNGNFTIGLASAKEAKTPIPIKARSRASRTRRCAICWMPTRFRGRITRRRNRIGTGSLWNAFDAIAAVRNGPEWKTNIRNSSKIFSDITQGKLANVALVDSDDVNSDHPGVTKDYGPSWVASIVNAIGGGRIGTRPRCVSSSSGSSGEHIRQRAAAVHGSVGQLGLSRSDDRRIALRARRRERSRRARRTQAIRVRQHLENLTENVRTWDSRKRNATSVPPTASSTGFDFTQQPRQFQKIGSSYSRAFFKYQKPSYLPVDSQ